MNCRYGSRWQQAAECRTHPPRSYVAMRLGRARRLTQAHWQALRVHHTLPRVTLWESSGITHKRSSYHQELGAACCSSLTLSVSRASVWIQGVDNSADVKQYRWLTSCNMTVSRQAQLSGGNLNTRVTVLCMHCISALLCYTCMTICTRTCSHRQLMSKDCCQQSGKSPR